MTPVVLLGLITATLAVLAALNHFYYYNVQVTTIFTVLAIVSLSITAYVFFHDDDD
jgi:hypothetical protein